MNNSSILSVFQPETKKIGSTKIQLLLPSKHNHYHERGCRAFLEVRKKSEQNAFPDLTSEEINVPEAVFVVAPAEMMETSNKITF
ncbi:MAG: hypothetical protein IKT08_07980 [Bacteroidales bacterium]|nr:hypothetical protein [Bacteroidales bacterium]